MLTLCDWTLVLAAYSYECLSQTIMSDASYDLYGQLAAERGTEIPCFLDYTGSWVLPAITRIEDVHEDQIGRALRYIFAEMGKDTEAHMPLIRAALERERIPYCCCNTDFNCWE